ncbi:MAG TPA: sulfite exporter TauE/SafE family protein [Candidatus Angelobacter sp.]|nr:sulfite exporter TauE/SafE family protein [Candidatus Angelobacter sp.]
MQLWTAFILGLVGSLHCAAMCGPLALALPVMGTTRGSFLAGRIIYNAGRLLTYCLLGVAVGLLGHGLALAGLQRWLSLSVGTAVLLALLSPRRFQMAVVFTGKIQWLKSKLSNLFHQRSSGSLLLMGVLNGFLPCGLVYAACAAAITAGGLLPAIEYMLGFGLGTLPMMLSIGLIRKAFPPSIRFQFQKLIPACFFLMGTLLILRGLSLGIPYVSPAVVGTCPNCH